MTRKLFLMQIQNQSFLLEVIIIVLIEALTNQRLRAGIFVCHTVADLSEFCMPYNHSKIRHNHSAQSRENLHFIPHTIWDYRFPSACPSDLSVSLVTGKRKNQYR